MWICARKHGPAPQKSTLPLTKSQSCCLAWYSCFAECGSKSTLMSGGAGGCAQGPVHCRWLYTCLCIACGSQSSTSHACCRTARASLHLLKRSLGLRCEVGPFLGLWGLHAFCLFLHCIPGMWNQHPGTKRKKAWMKDATCRSSTHSLQKAKRIYHGPGSANLEAGLPILILWPHFWVQNQAPVLGPQNTIATASWQQHPWYCSHFPQNWLVLGLVLQPNHHSQGGKMMKHMICQITMIIGSKIDVRHHVLMQKPLHMSFWLQGRWLRKCLKGSSPMFSAAQLPWKPALLGERRNAGGRAGSRDRHGSFGSYIYVVDPLVQRDIPWHGWGDFLWFSNQRYKHYWTIAVWNAHWNYIKTFWCSQHAKRPREPWIRWRKIECADIYNTRQCQIVGPPLYPVDSLKHLIIFASSVIEILRHINVGFTRQFTSQKRQVSKSARANPAERASLKFGSNLNLKYHPQNGCFDDPLLSHLQLRST